MQELLLPLGSLLPVLSREPESATAQGLPAQSARELVLCGWVIWRLLLIEILTNSFGDISTNADI